MVVVAGNPQSVERETPLQLLGDLYGYAEFRGQQEAAIDAAMRGRDALVLMPTGGGKSLCYQIPALLREGTGLVVSPLISLMRDQVDALQSLGVRAAVLNSTLSAGAERDVIAALETGAVDLLYLAPERALMPSTRALLARIPISIVAIDEAHCVAQWGHDFREDYLGLAELADALPGVPRMALTATATPATRSEIVERLELADPEIFVASFDRPNITYRVAAKTDARSQLARFLEAHRGEAGIVYCLSRKKTEATADWLNERGYPALAYHAGQAASVRDENQRRFLREDGVIVVATIAFGMGIDKPDVRFVAHLDLPKSLEAYYQETGRAGRDGEPAEAWLCYGLQDVVRLRQMLESGSGSESFKKRERARLESILGWCESIACRRQPLLQYFGETASEACGNCDNCLEPPTTVDELENAQKLLSAIYRTGQRFGVVHILDVLAGKRTEKVERFGHDALSVFGIGADVDKHRWRAIVRQLMVSGCILSDPERYGALVLRPEARPILRGDTSFELRKPAEKKTPRSPQSPLPAELDAADAPLFEALRDTRKQLADAGGVPPYVVFHDSTLRAIAASRPRDRDELLAINGVGQAKLDRYGDDILAVVAESFNSATG